MTLLKRGALLILLAAMLLPQSSAFGQVPAAESASPTVHADTMVRGRPPAETTAAAAVAAESSASRAAASVPTRGAQEVSAVSFVQVNSPFMWGNTDVGGLTVNITLEDASHALKGVPVQSKTSHDVNVDKTLYFETVFVDPSNPTQNVMIRPGDTVRVVTTGGSPPHSVEQLIVVDDVRAWTSYERDVVEGIAPPGSTVRVTKSASLSVPGGYVTPGSTLAYAETTASPSDGSFQVGAFKTTPTGTPAVADLDKGVTGFVRVVHADKNEVYTVHGQNPFVLESSSMVHGYAIKLPTAPPSLEAGVAATRPLPVVSVVHKGPSGAVKGSKTVNSGFDSTFDALLPSTITGGDSVEVSINGAPPTVVAAAPLNATIDVVGNQITGSGPANTRLTVAAGRIDGYVTSSSTFKYTAKDVTTDGAGNYSSGTFQCGSSAYLAMHPGSFGYLGFEDQHGAFIYRAFAAPSYHVMVDYPEVEGWIADGATGPTITVRGASGAVKHEAVAPPMLAWLTSQKLYTNVFFETTTSAFIDHGDTVTVVHPGRSATIPVSALTAYLDTDGDSVNGEGPAGQSLRVISLADRTSYRDLTIGADGKYRATQPFTNVSTSCAEAPKTLTFDPGDSGRTYANLPNGDALFAHFGRSIHVNLNENGLEVYEFVTRDIDWEPIPSRPVTLTHTGRDGVVRTKGFASLGGRTGKTKIALTDATTGAPIILRPGDSLRATFIEGPDDTNSRPVTIDFVLPLITATPDVANDTLGGVGPMSSSGRATLSGQATATAPPLLVGAHTAYPTVQFSRSGQVLQLSPGNTGTVSFTDTSARRIWAAWGATADAADSPLKISGWPRAGETTICGVAPAGATVEIEDATVLTQPVVIGSGSADGQRNFCVTVPELQTGQVLMAKSSGAYSQPVVIGGANRMLLALATK